MGTRDMRIGGGVVGIGEVGPRITDLKREIDRIKGKTLEDSFVQTDRPDVDTSFTPIFTPHKSGWGVTLKYFIPGFTTRLIIHLVKVNEVVDATTYGAVVKEKIKEITDTDRQAQSVEATFDTPPLESGTLYGIVDLIAFDQNNVGHSNPEAGPDYSGFPGNLLFTFTTPTTLANAASKPSAARIVKNTLSQTAEGVIADVAVRIFADDGETLTFAQQGTSSVTPKIVFDSDGSVAYNQSVEIEDPSLTFIDISIPGLSKGVAYQWTKNIATSGGESVVSTPASPVIFFAGGFADPSGGLTGLTLVSFTGVPSESGTGIDLTIVLHQPTPPYALKNFTLKRKKSFQPDSDYIVLIDRASLLDPIYNAAGNIELDLSGIDANVTKTYIFQLTVRSVGTITKVFTSGDINATTSISIPAGALAGIYTPNLIEGGQFLNSRDQFDGSGDTDSVGAGAFRAMAPTLAGPTAPRINKLATGVGGNSLDAYGIRWLDTTHRLLLNTNIHTLGGKPSYKLGRIVLPSQTYTCMFKLICDTADVTVDISVELWDAGKAAGTESIIKQTSTFVIPHAVPWALLIAILQVPPTYSQSGGTHWIQISLGSDPAHICYLDELKVKTGQGYDAWTPGQVEATLDTSVTVTTDTGVTSLENQGVPTLSADGTEFSVISGNLIGRIYL